MKTRLLRDIEVSEVGMGCMAFSHGYGQIPPEEYSVEAIRNACRNGYWASLEDGCRYGRKLMGQEENGQGWYSSAPCCVYIHSTVWSLCICPQADRFLYVPSKSVCLF